jgi:hypothetical protein
MRCPRQPGESGTGLSWDRLLEHRFDARLAPPACWSEVVEHLDHCSDCRHHAQSVDPTLMFLDLPEITVTDADIAEMKLAVRTLRGSSAVQRPSRWQGFVNGVRAGAEDLLAAPRRSPAAWRLAAAAMLALSLSASMVVPSGAGRQGASLAGAELADLSASNPTVEVGSVLGGSARALPASWPRAGTVQPTSWGSDSAIQEISTLVGDSSWGSSTLGDVMVEDPVVEDVVSPGARVYSFQAPDEKMAVVMVIDPTLDV